MNGLLKKLNMLYRKCPYSTIWENYRVAQLAQALYNEVVSCGCYSGWEFFDSYADTVKDYIVYYDIGKTKLSPRFQTESNFVLEEEVKLYQSHVKYGLQLLEEIFTSANLNGVEAACYMLLTEAIGDHHEAFDGTGFPNHKCGEDIQPFGRITALCEYVVTQHGAGVNYEQILQQFAEEPHPKFDPKLIALLPRALEQFEQNEKKEVEEVSTFSVGTAIETSGQGLYHKNRCNLFGYEAITQINDPKEGAIPLEVVMAIAEKSNRVYALSKVVIDNVFDLLARPETQGRLLVVTLPSKCLVRKSFMNDLVRRVGKEGETRLILLFADWSEVADQALAKENLQRLREVEVQVGIDDFGGNYSALSDLKDVAIDYVRLSSSLTDNILVDKRKMELVRSMCVTLKNLNIGLMAKDVREKEQAESLVTMGCNILSGNYLEESNG